MYLYCNCGSRSLLWEYNIWGKKVCPDCKRKISGDIGEYNHNSWSKKAVKLQRKFDRKYYERSNKNT